MDPVVPAESTIYDPLGLCGVQPYRERNVDDKYFEWLKQWCGLAAGLHGHAVVDHSVAAHCAAVTWPKT